MPSHHERFFALDRFAVVGHSDRKPFPLLTYNGLKARGKTVFAVDPSRARIAGDPAYPSLATLPEPVEGVVIETPPEETSDWVAQAAEAGIRDLWIHRKLDTPEALALAAERDLDLRTGTCAVMYLRGGFNAHGIHRWIMQRLGRY